MHSALPEKQEAPASPPDRTAALAWGFFALAAAFRLADLETRNLWTDEAWVALAVLKASPAEVLAAGKSTPPFYLLTVWALSQVAGTSEAILRALSFAFGLGTVLLFWPLARRLTTAAPALLGLAALTFSPVMVYFSKELKQYSGDAFFAVLVLLLAERLRGSRGDKGWVALALAGAVGLGYSHSLGFILPVALASLWLALPAQRFRVALTALFWAAAFGVFYFLFFRRQIDAQLLAYWSGDFPDFSSLT
ncbi:MAG: glycosyltransferase family 39 protein, partial [Deltaproteobacteria bacterium]|nr:glycosyltransferase family 39 protein [Deltaproteobacteria bacterium]